MKLGLIGWAFAAIGAIAILIGVYVSTFGLQRYVRRHEATYTAASLKTACRWFGLSHITFGLGFFGFVLINHLILQTAPLTGILLSVIVFGIAVVMPEIMICRGQRMLIRRHVATETDIAVLNAAVFCA